MICVEIVIFIIYFLIELNVKRERKIIRFVDIYGNFLILFCHICLIIKEDDHENFFVFDFLYFFINILKFGLIIYRIFRKTQSKNVNWIIENYGKKQKDKS
jgi:hypothetical protein